MGTPIWTGETSGAYEGITTNWIADTEPIADDAVIIPAGNSVAIATALDANDIDLLSFTVEEGYTGAIGTNTNEVVAPLQVSATTFRLAGSGVSYLKLKPHDDGTTYVIKAPARPAIGQFGLNLTTGATIPTLNIDLASGESVGVAAVAGETGTFTTINIDGDGDVTLGAGLTCTTLNIAGDGNIYGQAGIANINVISGSPKVYLQKACAASVALIVKAGTVYEDSTGTKKIVQIFDDGAVLCQGSVADLRVWTDTEVYGAGTLEDEALTIDFTNPHKRKGNGENIKLGSNISLARVAL